MSLRTYAWYRKKFRGHRFSNQYGKWDLADLLWNFRPLPVVRVPMRRLVHNLITMNTDDAVGSDRFIERALAVDGRWPILVFRDRSKLRIMDGVHRLWKAKHYGRREISARIVPLDDLLNLGVEDDG